MNQKEYPKYNGDVGEGLNIEVSGGEEMHTDSDEECELDLNMEAEGLMILMSWTLMHAVKLLVI